MKDIESKKILVVEDEPDVLTYLSTFFRRSGFEVTTASDGLDGFESAKTNLPDLISLDITMPKESGVRMYRNLLEDETTKDIPVIIVTGVTGEFKKFLESRKQVHPPAGYFEKPVDREALISKVREILT